MRFKKSFSTIMQVILAIFYCVLTLLLFSEIAQIGNMLHLESSTITLASVWLFTTLIVVVHPIYINVGDKGFVKPTYNIVMQVISPMCTPTKATSGSNGHDCYLNVDRITPEILGDRYKYCRGFNITHSDTIGHRLIIKPNGKVIIPLGFKVKLPDHIAVNLIPKSGFGLKTDLFIPNSPGLIDTDYRGEICVILTNLGTTTLELVNCKPICQITFEEKPKISVTMGDVDIDTDRGANGHGHSDNALVASK